MVEAVIFDLDGTLVDSEKVHRRTTQEVLRGYGLDVSEAEIEEHAGAPVREFFRSIKKKLGAGFDVDEAVERKSRLFDTYAEDVKPFPGAVDAVKQLADRYHVAVGSSGTHDHVHMSVRMLGLEDVFQTVVTADDVDNGKPEPDIFLRASELLGVRPEDAVVIEDTENGVTAAKKGGFRVAGFNSSGTADLSEADTVVGSMEEFVEWVRTLDS